jgi:hypothetical protein
MQFLYTIGNGAAFLLELKDSNRSMCEASVRQAFSPHVSGTAPQCIQIIYKS